MDTNTDSSTPVLSVPVTDPLPTTNGSETPLDPASTSRADPAGAPPASTVEAAAVPGAVAGTKADNGKENTVSITPEGGSDDGGNGAVVAAADTVTSPSLDSTAHTTSIATSTSIISTTSGTDISDVPDASEDTEALAAALIKAANAAAVEVGATGAAREDGGTNAAGSAEQPRRKRTRRGGWDTPAASGGVVKGWADSSNPSAATAVPATTMAPALPTPMQPPMPAMTPMQEYQKKLAQEQVAAAMGQAPSVTSVSAGAAALGLAMNPGGAAPVAAAPTAPSIPDNPRRIYVGSIHYNVKESDIVAIFRAFGPITSVEMSKDPMTGHHKGFCFLEFADYVGAESSLGVMNGFELAGRALRVGRPHNAGGVEALPPAMQLPGMAAFMAQRSAAAQGSTAAEQLKAAMTMSSSPPPMTKIYVGNVEPHITTDMIKTIFEPFGTVVGAEMVPDPSNPGNHKGFGFIQYAQESVAKTVLDTMASFELAGRNLKVAWAQDQSKPALSVNSAAAAAAAAGAAVGAAAQAAAMAAKVASSASSGGAAMVAANVYMSATEQLQAALRNGGIGAGGVGTGSLGPGAVMGPSLGQEGAMMGYAQKVAAAAAAAAQRTELMRKIVEGRMQGAMGMASPGTPSRCVCLKNMLQPEEADDVEARQDILKESETCGSVEQLLVHQQRAPGGTVVGIRVFVVFSTLEAAATAVKKMHGRFFGGKQVEAVLYDFMMFSRGALDAF